MSNPTPSHAPGSAGSADAATADPAAKNIAATNTAADPIPAPGGLEARARAALETSRRRTLALTGCVDEADLKAQHSPLMSPLVWDLAHIGNQEEIWLVREAGGRPALRPDLGLPEATVARVVRSLDGILSRRSRVELREGVR